MISQGYLILFHEGPDKALQASPALAPDEPAARQQFQAQRPEGAAPARIVAVLSLHDLERHRRAILSLADRAGQDLAVGTLPPQG